MTHLVTGATGGLGLEMARQLVQQGHEVWVHGRSEQSAARARATVGAERAFHADLGRTDQVMALAEAVIDAGGAALDWVGSTAALVAAGAAAVCGVSALAQRGWLGGGATDEVGALVACSADGSAALWSVRLGGRGKIFDLFDVSDAFERFRPFFSVFARCRVFLNVAGRREASKTFQQSYPSYH